MKICQKYSLLPDNSRQVQLYVIGRYRPLKRTDLSQVLNKFACCAREPHPTFDYNPRQVELYVIGCYRPLKRTNLSQVLNKFARCAREPHPPIDCFDIMRTNREDKELFRPHYKGDRIATFPI
ncbi:hypothetical protein TNIN_217961, partial [Trichonephila inaurata madagascariensis]